MDSELDETPPTPKRLGLRLLIIITTVTTIFAVVGFLLWDNRASVAEVAIINFFESRGIEVKDLTVSKSDADGLTIQNLHLYHNGDINIDRVAARYSIQGLQRGRIDSFEINNTTYTPPSGKALLVIGRTIGDANANRENSLDGSTLKMTMTKVKVKDQPIQSARFKTETVGGIAKSQLIIQVDLTQLQINSETNLKHKSWATSISVDSLIYIKELTKIIGLDHQASGWLSIQAKGKFEGIGALLGNDDKNKALEGAISIKLRARQLANILGLPEGTAGSDKLSLDLTNVRATPESARARFRLYSYATGRTANIFTYQSIKLNLEGVVRTDKNEAKIRMEKGNLAIDLPVYLGDVFLRDQIEVGLHSLKNYISYKYKDGTIDYLLKLQPLPLFLSIPTHRATVRTNWDLDKIIAKSDGEGRHAIKISVYDIRVPTYALKASNIELNAAIQNGKTTFDLSVGKLKQTDLTPVLVPLSVNGKASSKDGLLKGTIQATAPNTGLNFNAKFYNDSRSFQGNFEYTFGQLNFGHQGDDIKKVSPLLATKLKSVQGKIAVSGGAHWSAGAASQGHLQVRFNEVSTKAEAANISKITGTLALTSIFPPATNKIQKLTALLSVGDLKAFPLEINWRLNPDGSLALTPFIAQFAGGTLSTNTVLFHPNAEIESFLLAVNKVDVTEIFRLIGIKGLSGKGRLSGIIPIQVKGKKVIVKVGKLTADGPGVIRFDGDPLTKSLKKKGNSVATTLKILSDFHYQTMRIGLEKTREGNGAVKLSINGTNPKAYTDHPLIFTVNLESNFNDLAKFTIQGLETAKSLLSWLEEIYRLNPRNRQTDTRLR